MAALAAVTLIIWFAVQWGSENLRVSQARQELHELAVALEEYKAQHGSYLQRSDRAAFFETLMQKRNSPGLKYKHQRWINPARFFYATPDPEAPGNYLVDPWAREYRYIYRPAGRGQAESYWLFSVGPDGRASNPARWGGDGRGRERMDADNIYAP